MKGHRHPKIIKLSLIILIVSQFLDGILTYLGVDKYGHDIEGNPIIRNLIINYGLLEAIMVTKIFSLGCLFYLAKKDLSKSSNLTILFMHITSVFYVVVVFMWLQFLFFSYK